MDKSVAQHWRDQFEGRGQAPVFGQAQARSLLTIYRTHFLSQRGPKRLGSTAALVDTTVTDPAEALERQRAARSVVEPLHVATPADSPPPELQAIEAELARRHWDAWLDTKVPALGNRTPRQAAKTASGRERLEALLADYSQKRVSSRNAFQPDIVALKQKLGLA